MLRSLRPRPARWMPRLVVVTLALALAAGCGRSSVDPAASPARILIVAVESMGWEKIDALVAKGELPHLARLLREGTRARAIAPDPLDASMLWTSAFTGKAPAQHKVAGELAILPDGTRTLVPSGMRPTRNLQQIAGSNGHLIVSVGIPVTWPAEVINGFLVAPGAAVSRWTSTDEHTAQREPSELATYPPNLWPEIAPMLRSGQPIRREDVSRFFTLNESEFGMVYDQPLGSIYKRSNPLKDFAITYQRDAAYVDVTRHLIQQYSPRVAMVHLELLDTLQPVYWRFGYPEIYDTPADSRRRFASTVDQGYRRIDEQIGELMQTLPAGSTVIVMSERGFGNGAIEDDQGTPQPSPIYSNEAVMILWGQGIQAGKDLGRVGVADLTPTVLAMLGVPLGADMQGSALVGAMRPEFAASHPRRAVETHDRDWNQATRYPEGVAVAPDDAEKTP